MSLVSTPYNDVPIYLQYASIEQKVYRDQYCKECGHPFVAISDKIVVVSDAGVPVEMLAREDKLVEARCRHTRCRQFYRFLIGKE